MTLQRFATLSSLASAQEVEKVRLLAFYVLRVLRRSEFALTEILGLFSTLHFATPNTSRLEKRMKESRSFVKAAGRGLYRLHARDMAELDAAFPAFQERSEEVESTDSVMPTPLYAGTRGYIESLSKQINASYEHNVFDGCAVLMRRLLEILLVLAYEALGIGNSIKDGKGDYKQLNGIIEDAKINAKLGLSRNSRGCIDDFRTLGNFSAHKIEYNARRQDIKPRILEFRALCEELLYKTGIKK
jgi:hypothetical protein